MQPFKSGMIVGRDDFCGRTEEIKQLKSYIESRNRFVNEFIVNKSFK